MVASSTKGRSAIHHKLLAIAKTLSCQEPQHVCLCKSKLFDTKQWKYWTGCFLSFSCLGQPGVWLPALFCFTGCTCGRVSGWLTDVKLPSWNCEPTANQPATPPQANRIQQYRAGTQISGLPTFNRLFTATMVGYRGHLACRSNSHA